MPIADIAQTVEPFAYHIFFFFQCAVRPRRLSRPRTYWQPRHDFRVSPFRQAGARRDKLLTLTIAHRAARDLAQDFDLGEQLPELFSVPNRFLTASLNDVLMLFSRAA